MKRELKNICNINAKSYWRVFESQQMFFTLGTSITRASYNKAFDSHTLFIDAERKAILQRLGVGSWKIFGAHGFKKDYDVTL